MKNGWIKLHRKITEWEWYKDLATSKLFIHLVIMANHEDKSWQGVEVKRGQLITGRKVLAEETGLSEQQIRTSLTKLKSTSEITINSTNKYTIVTVCEYETYQLTNNDINQQVNQQPNQQSTNNQPQTRIIRSKEDKNIPPLPPKGDTLFLEDFEVARKLYPGTKRGRDTEFSEFKKKHKDWKDCVELLTPAIEREIQYHKEQGIKGAFCPPWKNFKTWLNQRCWEFEFELEFDDRQFECSDERFEELRLKGLV